MHWSWSGGQWSRTLGTWLARQPVRKAVSYRGLFTAGWFDVTEKHCSQLEIYDRLRASEQAEKG